MSAFKNFFVMTNHGETFPDYEAQEKSGGFSSRKQNEESLK